MAGDEPAIVLFGRPAKTAHMSEAQQMLILFLIIEPPDVWEVLLALDSCGAAQPAPHEPAPKHSVIFCERLPQDWMHVGVVFLASLRPLRRRVDARIARDALGHGG